MTYKIPIGPYHPALEEPYKIELICEGEVIKDTKLKVGFNFRGIEFLAQKRSYYQDIALVERVCGICSNVHTLTFCQAIEKLAGITVSERAQYIRVILCELERLHSHSLWAGVAAELIGFQTVFMVCFKLRENVMDILEMISGNRVNYGMNCVGGVNRDISDTTTILNSVDTMEKELTGTIIPIFTSNRIVQSRCAGVGILTHEQAQNWGTVGPTARASGIDQDIRKSSAYAVYDRLDFNTPVQQNGDVLARLVVRALEMLESVKIIRQAIEQIPAGDWKGPNFYEVPAGITTSRLEGPRGEVFYYLESDGTEIPKRLKIRTPSFANMPTVQLMLKNASLADAPLIQASIDPCYSCTDR